MAVSSRIAMLACAALMTIVPAAAAEPPPDATTTEVTEIGPDSATLNGTVNPQGSETTYRFRYGTSALDVETAPAPAGGGGAPVAVAARVTGLSPDTAYRVELVANGPRHERAGGEVTFRTAPASSPAPPSDAPPQSPAPALVANGGVFGAPPPVFGERVNVTVRDGLVFVSAPGEPFVQIMGFASVPVGSRLNTRSGSVIITSALPGAALSARAAQAGTSTQSGIFHGGLFDVLQPMDGGGWIELVIRGRPLSRCRESVVAGASLEADRRRKRPRALWGNVRRGNFRIRGGNSVASVRGTKWFVEDLCEGTVTRVSRGSVRVRDLVRQRTLVLRAGERYLARIRR